MSDPRLVLFAALGLIAIGYLSVWLKSMRDRFPLPTFLGTGIGFVTNFFDTLGIGSYAPTTALYRFFKLVPDEKIPGTMNVGHTAPTITQAFIFIAIVTVEFTTLVVLIAAAMAGAWLGAGVVAGLPKRKIQIGMGGALLVAATLFTLTNLGVIPGGGDAIALTGGKLVAGVVGNFVLGSLMTLGIGLYGPSLIMIALLGMNPTVGFPIMMGSCAFLMPLASVRFLKAGAYEPRPAVGLSLGGLPAVLLAAFLVKSLPLQTVRWLVIVVVLYAAFGLLKAGIAKAGAKPPPPVSRNP
ncbi:MAG: sulfite exporter TauE/SafE family protein [Gemmatimonadales bacterium]